MDGKCVARVMVPILGDNHDELAIGTGYAITPRLVLTARHVVEPRRDGKALFDEDADIQLEFVHRRSMGAEGTEEELAVAVPRSAVIHPSCAELDLVLLKLEQPLDSVGCANVSRSRPEALRTDSRWETEGFPALAEGYLGSHAGYKLAGKLYRGDPGEATIELDVDSGAETWVGLSGAPVFDLSQQTLVGVITDELLSKRGVVSGEFFSDSGELDKQIAGQFVTRKSVPVLEGKRLFALAARSLLDDPALSRAYIAEVREYVDLTELEAAAARLLDRAEKGQGIAQLRLQLGLPDNDAKASVEKLWLADPTDVLEAIAVAERAGMDSKLAQECCWTWLVLSADWHDLAGALRVGGTQRPFGLNKLSLVEMAMAQASARPAAFRYMNIEGRRTLLGVHGLPIGRLEAGLDASGEQAARDFVHAVSLSIGHSEPRGVEQLREYVPEYIAKHIAEGASIQDARARLRVYHKVPDPRWTPPYAVLAVFGDDEDAHIESIVSAILRAFENLLPVVVVNLRDSDERSAELDQWLVRVFKFTTSKDDASTPQDPR